MAAVPQAYRQLAQTLLGAARNGRPPARLQVEEVARQCAAWSEPENSFYSGLVQRLTGVPDALRGQLDAAARVAAAATAGLGVFLSAELLPLAREKDACGPEVYARASRSRRIDGRENFRAWMQELADRTISQLHGTHFDIPEPAHRIEAMIAPADDGGIYYTEPSEDWSRPGRLWWSVPAGIDTFSTWKEVTAVYHEAVPGHHLQISQVRAEQENLNRTLMRVPSRRARMTAGRPAGDGERPPRH
jgi:uncharacterized protein (DUF885 family)